MVQGEQRATANMVSSVKRRPADGANVTTYRKKHGRADNNNSSSNNNNNKTVVSIPNTVHFHMFLSEAQL